MNTEPKTWPFEQARSLLKRVGDKTCVIFESGYSPSGAPHCGTWSEVKRTSMVRHAFEELTEGQILTRLIAFSDDYDGFRKVPQNMPESMEADLGKPLTRVRDPFGEYPSFAARNNDALRIFLDELGIDYEFMSSTECYQSGMFNDMMVSVCQNYDAIRDIMLPTLGEARQATYSPFMPISPVTGNVLAEGVTDVDPSRNEIRFIAEDGNAYWQSIKDGHAKLQWRGGDWAMRWAALGIDYEMHGKDLIDSQSTSTKICKILGGKPPLTYSYELFLDDEGRKQSKSLGNGMSMEEWMRYSGTGPLAHFMFQTPKTAKTFSSKVIPRVTDDYLKALATFPSLEGAARLDSPVWHIHSGNPPSFNSDISYSLLLNLAMVSGAKDEETVLNYVRQYKNISENDLGMIQALIPGVIEYARLRLSQKTRRDPTDMERAAFASLIRRLSSMEDGLDGEAYQYEVYEVGKEFPFEPMRAWFQSIYEVLFGDTQGPRFGSFISAYGRTRTIDLLEEVIGGGAS